MVNLASPSSTAMYPELADGPVASTPCHARRAATAVVHEAVAAMQYGASVDDLVATIRAHPTLSVGLGEAAEDVFGQATHKPIARPRGERHALAA